VSGGCDEDDDNDDGGDDGDDDATADVKRSGVMVADVGELVVVIGGEDIDDKEEEEEEELMILDVVAVGLLEEDVLLPVSRAAIAFILACCLRVTALLPLLLLRPN
jgi:hypothetical protein